MKSDENGLLHIYCGNGKGKTTAAAGLAARASGAGLRVMLVQFLKNGTGFELESLKKLGVFVYFRHEPQKFVSQMTSVELDKCAKCCQNCFEVVRARLPEFDVVILDEILGASMRGFISEDELISLIEARPPAIELVLTGRNPSERLCGLADYISEINEIKHPFRRGVSARRGIEY